MKYHEISEKNGSSLEQSVLLVEFSFRHDEVPEV